MLIVALALAASVTSIITSIAAVLTPARTRRVRLMTAAAVQAAAASVGYAMTALVWAAILASGKLPPADGALISSEPVRYTAGWLAVIFMCGMALRWGRNARVNARCASKWRAEAETAARPPVPLHQMTPLDYTPTKETN